MNFREFIIYWNNKYPFDRIWRQKYKIAFNSKKHRHIRLFDIVFDLKESDLFDEFYKEFEDKKKRKEELSQGIVLREKEYTEEEKININKMLDSIPLDAFDDIVSFDNNNSE